VKFDTSVKDADVYIDGAYAGTVGKLKTMQLRPGSYDIEVRAPGRTQFDKKVYVAAGKTLHLNPDLRVQARPQAQPYFRSFEGEGKKRGRCEFSRALGRRRLLLGSFDPLRM
jgi:hypothetical protein